MGLCVGPAAHVVQGSDVGLVIGDKVHVSTPQDDKRKTGLAW